MIIFAATAVYILGQVLRVAEMVRTHQRRKQDSELLDYLLERELVICPDCRIAFRVTTLEEQLNTQWECRACRCQFREFSHHTAKAGEL